ncbi:hypothetical protein FD12_GL000110 [Lentilactobacillus rapi DSM 19907 = JCM 15042]|uniref:Transposase n=1 Tax=Lentilactobacillus rapi DSM 19907 = JCM 15042 TaxID=1423795 RepID=A0ABR5PCH1_9LACO|nr:hypothetical protein FD12_GL000110 [Lentilactobacillus rapi DSM 19907 = JCM 15042]
MHHKAMHIRFSYENSNAKPTLLKKQVGFFNSAKWIGSYWRIVLRKAEVCT